MLRSNSKSLGNHIVSLDEEKERLQWKGFAEKEGFKSGMRERVGGGKLRPLIISMTVSGINRPNHIHRWYNFNNDLKRSCSIRVIIFTVITE